MTEEELAELLGNAYQNRTTLLEFVVVKVLTSEDELSKGADTCALLVIPNWVPWEELSDDVHIEMDIHRASYTTRPIKAGDWCFRRRLASKREKGCMVTDEGIQRLIDNRGAQPEKLASFEVAGLKLGAGFLQQNIRGAQEEEEEARQFYENPSREQLKQRAAAEAAMDRIDAERTEAAKKLAAEAAETPGAPAAKRTKKAKGPASVYQMSV